MRLSDMPVTANTWECLFGKGAAPFRVPDWPEAQSTVNTPS